MATVCAASTASMDAVCLKGALKMFKTLVISATERRKRRTARFFCGTAVFYMLSVAAAFALSIVISNPNMADTSEHAVLIMTPPSPPPGASPRPTARQPEPAASPRNDLRQVADLDRVLAAPVASNRNVPPSASLATFTGDGSSEGTGNAPAPDGIGSSLPFGNGHGEETAPPRPPEPPRPAPQNKPDDARPVRLTSNVLQGKAIVRRTPDYPPLARQIRLEGSVSVEVIIAPDGRVESARAISGHTLFKATAEAAAQGWRFGPTLLNGVAVRVTGVIVFNFTLQ
jgi:TonB family protein